MMSVYLFMYALKQWSEVNWQYLASRPTIGFKESGCNTMLVYNPGSLVRQCALLAKLRPLSSQMTESSALAPCDSDGRSIWVCRCRYA